jgi:hypothetical protein
MMHDVLATVPESTHDKKNGEGRVDIGEGGDCVPARTMQVLPGQYDVNSVVLITWPYPYSFTSIVLKNKSYDDVVIRSI